MVSINCENCGKKFSDKRGLHNHHKRKVPCTVSLKCELCKKIFNTSRAFERHQNRKTPCVSKNYYRPVEDEIKILEKKKEIEIEILEKKSEIDIKKIEVQKEKELAVEEKKLERKKTSSVRTTINNIAQQVNIHFPAATIISATYENCMEKIVIPFLDRIRTGQYDSYKLVYESSLDKFEIATTVLKDIFQDEKMPDTHNMIYVTEQDIFMVALHKAWVYKQFDYVAKIINDTFRQCFSTIKKCIGEPIRGNFMSEKTYNRAMIRYAEIEELANSDISVEDLENVSKEGLNIDDIINGKKMLRI